MIVAAVDEHLCQARQLLGTGAVAIGSAPSMRTELPNLAGSWSGGAGAAAALQESDLQQRRQSLFTTAHAVSRIGQQVPAIARGAQAQMAAIESGWCADKASVGAAGGSLEGGAALLAAGRRRIAEADELVAATTRDYSNAAHAVRAAQSALSPEPAGLVVHPTPEPEPPAPPVCYTGTENGPLGQCPDSTTDILYFDRDRRLVHKDLATGDVEPEFGVRWEGGVGVSESPGLCFLPSETADRAGCPAGTTDWRFPRGNDYVIELGSPGGELSEHVITPGTPLWN